MVTSNVRSRLSFDSSSGSDRITHLPQPRPSRRSPSARYSTPIRPILITSPSDSEREVFVCSILLDECGNDGMIPGAPLDDFLSDPTHGQRSRRLVHGVPSFPRNRYYLANAFWDSYSPSWRENIVEEREEREEAKKEEEAEKAERIRMTSSGYFVGRGPKQAGVVLFEHEVEVVESDDGSDDGFVGGVYEQSDMVNLRSRASTLDLTASEPTSWDIKSMSWDEKAMSWDEYDEDDDELPELPEDWL